jgi:hypothetical protein
VVCQRYKTAAERACRERSDAAEEHARGRAFRESLEVLPIELEIRAELVEHAKALQCGFE